MRAILFLLPALAGLAACRGYDSYGPLASEAGLVPATRFARYGREQASLMAIGRSLAAWRMSNRSDDLEQQARQVRCFALRLPEVDRVDPDPLGHRLMVSFKSGWRTAIVPAPDGVEPSETPGIGPLLPPPPDCR